MLLRGAARSLGRAVMSGSGTPGTRGGVRRALSQLPLPLSGYTAGHDTAGPKPAKIDFTDTKVAYGDLSTGELLRALLVFRLCSVRPLVQHADSLLRQCYAILGKAPTEALVRATFFSHFCAGEDSVSIKPRVASLRKAGVGGILDYAAEADSAPSTAQAYAGGDIQCRVYDYQSERQCDAHVNTFLDCIRAVKDVSPEGFAAIKLTALGNPILLERMSTCIAESRKLWERFDQDRKGHITRAQFREGWSRFFVPDAAVDRLVEQLDPLRTDRIDYIEWSNTLRLEDLPTLTSRCKESGPLKLATLSAEETQLMVAMRKRIDTLASTAASLGVRLMIDAEQTYFQPAIDNTITDLQRRYNREYPAVFGTYQCYLKDAHTRLKDDMGRAKRHKYHFAAKLVRGAYMLSERKRAAEMGYESPIHETIEDTHRCYDGAVEAALQAIAGGDKVEILIASHNQSSVEKTLARMGQLGIPADRGVYFGQLLGMADHLTLTLGKNGFKSYKYLPYGKVGEVLPYLIRRAQENGDVLGGGTRDIALVNQELKRRGKALLGMA